MCDSHERNDTQEGKSADQFYWQWASYHGGNIYVFSSYDPSANVRSIAIAQINNVYHILHYSPVLLRV